MIEGISAVTLGTHEMPRAVRFYRGLGFEVLHGDEESSFTSFRVGVSCLNLIAQPAERRWSWWGRVSRCLATARTFLLPAFARQAPASHSQISASLELSHVPYQPSTQWRVRDLLSFQAS